MVGYYLRLCMAIGAIPESEKTEMFVDSASERRADELFWQYGIGERGAVVAIAPGAAYGSSKLWVSENFAFVADALAEAHGFDVVLVGGPNEKRIANEICEAARSKPANFVEENMSLALLKSVMKRCDLLITLDSGPRHFAVAFDKLVVVLMGPTSPRYTNCNLEKTVLLKVDRLDCAPCQLKKCPTNHECMTRITPDNVLSAVTDLLQKHGRS